MMPSIQPPIAATGVIAPATEISAIKRVRDRLVPYMMLMYVVSFLDRANISFAKQALHTSVGISEHAYALAAGLFFVGYALCGFPSNLFLHRVGAKRWLTFLMLAWGLASMATVFVSGNASLYLVRLILGVAEAGFFPGAILYLTYWFPGRVRGEVIGLFYLGVPLAMILGGPLSGFLLETRTLAGLVGWQWMFLVEGFIAVVLGVFSYWYLDNRPADAHWLPPEEKKALTEALASEEAAKRIVGPTQLLPMLHDMRVLRLLLVYGLIQMSTYGAIFYLPTEVSALLHKPAGFEVGLVSAIPWICALLAVYFVPRAGDRTRRHRELAALTLLIAGSASFAFPVIGPTAGLVALSVAVSGFIAVQPLFWTLPTGYLADRAAAGGIALIGMGNLGGFLAPNVKVWADEFFKSPNAGLYLLATVTVLNAGLIATTKIHRAMD